LVAIGLAAFAVEIPFFFLGTPSGHDVEFHLYSWLEVLGQWHQGIIFPRWAAMANTGCGEPRFLFYPPASWTLGALISAIVPWTFAASVYIWVVLVAAGASMFVLARRWLARRDAIFAAVLVAAFVALDGESNWLEGAMLLAVYVIVAIAFFYLPSVGGTIPHP